MTGNRGNDYLVGLVQELCKLPKETEWLEFKLNMRTPKGIGEYISALSNAATLAGKNRGYLIWGVRDEDHAILGTQFDPKTPKPQNPKTP